MNTNSLIVSKDIFFLYGLHSILDDAVVPSAGKRIVIIDARLECIDFDYTPRLNDYIIFIKNESYEPALKKVFYDYFGYGQFITAASGVDLIKNNIIEQKLSQNNSTCHLTDAEKLLISTLISAGTYYKCAKRLSISCKTVSHHKVSVMNKLGLRKLNHLFIISKLLIPGICKMHRSR